MNTTTFIEVTDEELMMVNGGISSYQAGKYVGYGIDVLLGAAVIALM